MKCKVQGCSNSVHEELHDLALCLEHFLDDIQDRIRGLSYQVSSSLSASSFREITMQFIVLTAAKIATIGSQNPPAEQLTRGRLLNAMLLLADLRDRLDKATGQRSDA